MQLQSVPGEPSDATHVVSPDAARDAADRLLDHGVVLVGGDLTNDRVGEVAARLLTLAHGGAHEAVTVHLSSVGGSVAAALALHDVIAGLGTAVKIVAAGLLDTAGAVVLHAGTAGERALLPSARVHLRRPAEPDTPDLDLESAAQEVAHLRVQAEAVLGVPLHPPRLLTAEEAVGLGLADRISLHGK